MPSYGAVPALGEPIQGIDPLLTIEEVAAIYRKSPGTIKNLVQAGKFNPVPFEKYPYRWRKMDIERDLMTRKPYIYRPHGFATTKRTKRPKG